MISHGPAEFSLQSSRLHTFNQADLERGQHSPSSAVSVVSLRPPSTGNPKQRKNALTTAQYNYHTESTSILSSLPAKDNLHRAESRLQISILSEEAPQKWHLFWHKHEKECGQARTCPLWKLAPQKWQIVCTTLLSACVCGVVCLCAFACMCKQYLSHSFHSSDSSGCPCLQIADRDSPLLVCLHLGMKLEECRSLDSEEVEPEVDTS